MPVCFNLRTVLFGEQRIRLNAVLLANHCIHCGLQIRMHAYSDAGQDGPAEAYGLLAMHDVKLFPRKCCAQMNAQRRASAPAEDINIIKPQARMLETPSHERELRRNSFKHSLIKIRPCAVDA
jgi:hypothetical protein